MAYEHSFDAHVRDVSKPALARLKGLGDWLGFDPLSIVLAMARVVSKSRKGRLWRCVSAGQRMGKGRQSTRPLLALRRPRLRLSFTGPDEHSGSI
jgi:hypothetical protein